MDEMEQHFQRWANGYGVIVHHEHTQAWVKKILKTQCSSDDQETVLKLFEAADRITNAAMWLVVHQTYAQRVDLKGAPLEANDFKLSPQGHTGGSLNMVPAYVGYLLANAISDITRSWVMGQGHCVAAIDSVNLLLDNMRPEHAERYSLTQEGLTRYVNDFYSYRLNEQGQQDSPLGSHVNIHTAGGYLEGGYLGFADLQYVHMPLPGECLIAFLSDGAFEEQRGSDWAPRWWRAEDTGFVVPIMIYNGRRIDQRSMLSQGPGLSLFIQHLKTYHFDPIIFDGTDPAAFACMILEGEYLFQERCQSILQQKTAYPILLPYGVAVAKKGAGFYGEGTNAAHNLPLGTLPCTDSLARKNFNAGAQKLFVPLDEILQVRQKLMNHAQTHRLHERDHPIANRKINMKHYPALHFLDLKAGQVSNECPMSAIDATFLAYVQANPDLRPRVGNPDEMLSNHMRKTLDSLKHRVTEVELGVAEAIDGKVITVLNEEAVVCACLGNKAGINLVVTYEAFAPKMLGAIRQELNWSDHLLSQSQEPGWLSVPIVLTSHTYENGKNERSHQDPTMCEALLGEPSDISRVLFPADYNTAVAALDACYHTQGKIFTLIASKERISNYFNENHAKQLLRDGLSRVTWGSTHAEPNVIITAIGSYQLQQALLAAKRLEERNVFAAVNYMIEPARFRYPRSKREADFGASDELSLFYYPPQIKSRIFVTHTHPEVMAGILRPLDIGAQSVFLGFVNQGGTLDTPGMLFVNRQTWAHIVQACAQSLGMALEQLLESREMAALCGHMNPQGIII